MLMTRVFYYSLTTGVHELDFDFCPTSAHGNIYAAVGFKYVWKLCTIKRNLVHRLDHLILLLQLLNLDSHV